MNPRDHVTTRVAQRARQFPDLDITSLDVSELQPRDAALARAIDHIVARRWLTLSAILNAKTDQPWDRLQSHVQAPLLVGAAQLLFMERVPDHAIVNDAVEWTKRHGRTKAGGLVNAVLRCIAAVRGKIIERAANGAREMPRNVLPLDDGRSLSLTKEVFDPDPFVRLAQQTSHPVDVLMRWKSAFGDRTMIDLAQHNLVHPPIIVTGFEDARDEPHLQPHDAPGFFVFTGAREELDDLLARHHGTRVQDPATAHAVESMAETADPPALIIDLCAGMGTKTRQLSALFPEARIIATDVDARRFDILRDAVAAGNSRIEVIPFADIRRLDEQAELLVIDATCSNSGVLARRVEAKYRLTSAYLEEVAALQRQILADAIPLLSPSGGLLYITCSIEREENEAQAAWLGKWHGLKVARESRLMPHGLPGEPPNRYADGGYAALMKRQEGNAVFAPRSL